MSLNPFKKKSEARSAFQNRTGATDEVLDASDDIYILVAIYDVKAKEIITQPVPYKNEDVAQREFAKLVNHQGSMFNSSPHDFIMKKLAQIHVRQGNIWPCEPETLFTGTDVYQQNLQTSQQKQLEAFDGRPQ